MTTLINNPPQLVYRWSIACRRAQNRHGRIKHTSRFVAFAQSEAGIMLRKENSPAIKEALKQAWEHVQQNP